MSRAKESSPVEALRGEYEAPSESWCSWAQKQLVKGVWKQRYVSEGAITWELTPRRREVLMCWSSAEWISAKDCAWPGRVTRRYQPSKKRELCE